MKFPYDQRFSPPAPMLTVELFAPDIANRRAQVSAKLDTAADITAVPLQLLTGWGLEPESEVLVSGYDGVMATVQTYTVAFELPDARIRRMEVIPIPDDYVLIGRDILNNFYIDLDGPELTFEIRVSRDSDKQQPPDS